MKKRWIVAGLLLTLVAVPVIAVQTAPIHVATWIDRVKNPVHANQPVAWAQGPETAPNESRPPNIILIVADDLGINDLTSTGRGVASGAVPTPHIDSLARDGVSFLNGYAGNATCSPSRAAMMTGRYPMRFGFEFTAVPKQFAQNIARSGAGRPHPTIYHGEREGDMPSLAMMGVPGNETMISELLRDHGYHTMHIGKWHIGEASDLRPEAQGFSESLGFMSGAAMFGPKSGPDVIGARLDYDPIDRFLWIYGSDAVQWNGGLRFRVDDYMTDYFSREAVSAIAANRNRPFFMYLAYNAPHTPLQAAREDYDALPQIEDHTQRVYGAMIRSLDRGVGEVLDALKQNGIDDNTIVIFTSDNGGAWYTGLTDINAPYRGWKATFFEGGIRVPYFIRWPDGIEAGLQSSLPAHHLDLFPTIAAAAGIPADIFAAGDGRNLLAALEAPEPESDESPFFWKSGGYRAVRHGGWKLQVADNPSKTWLFDLTTDPTEQTNVAEAHPEIVSELRQLLDGFESELPEPLWPALLEDAIRIDVPLNAPWREDQEFVYWSN